VISKLGCCSRSDAEARIRAGRVSVDGRVVLDPERATDPDRERIRIDGELLVAPARRYLMLNKPRGLVTSARDERDRATVYRCLDGAGLPWLAPVGRLDRASEGLLLMCNDPQWAARITDPATGPEKTYHVQVDRVPDAALARLLEDGVIDAGEPLRAKSARVLRAGSRHGWLEVVLDEGRNRQIRRLLQALDTGVLRLVRVAVGPLQLGPLAKGSFRELSPSEVRSLSAPMPTKRN
jgi:23S rRNA pseudouridine2605 synthase